METIQNRDEKIELTLSTHDKKIFEMAQKISGDRSFSSFIIRIVKEQAVEILAKNERLIASEKDRDLFFKAVFEGEKANATLMEAADRYKAKSKSED